MDYHLHHQVLVGFAMSRGLGIVQRRLVAAFQLQPTPRVTVKQLAEVVFPAEQIERKHLVSVRRALKNLPGVDLHVCRIARSGAHGWCYVIGSAK
jgi:hypothetical protein